MRFAGREGVVWGTDTTSPGPDPPALVYATSDGGLTWKASRTSFGAGQLYFLTPSEGWAMGSVLNQVPPSTIFHTTDAGQTWERSAHSAFPARASGSCTGGGSVQGLITTSDGAVHWQRASLPRSSDG